METLLYTLMFIYVLLLILYFRNHSVYEFRTKVLDTIKELDEQRIRNYYTLSYEQMSQIKNKEEYFKERLNWFNDELPSYDLMVFNFITPTKSYLKKYPIPDNGNELFFKKYYK